MKIHSVSLSQIKLLFLVFIAITGIFIRAIFLFGGHQTLKTQKVNAQYNQDNINNNNNNNSINNNYKKINFTNAFNLTNNTKDYVYPRVSAFKNNVYWIWNKEPQSQINYNDNSNKILFRTIADGGPNFKSIKTLSNNVNSLTCPKITTSPSTNNISSRNVYAIWNVGHPGKDLYRNSDSIFFTKNDDNGDNFSNLTKINGHIKSIGKPQIILYKNNIHVI